MQQYSNNFQDVYGNAITGASITVYNEGTETAATLFEDDETTSKSNPLTTDANGQYSFKAADGDYDIKHFKSGYSIKLLYDIQLLDRAAIKITLASLTGTTYDFKQDATPTASAADEWWLETDSGKVFKSTASGTENWVEQYQIVLSDLENSISPAMLSEATLTHISNQSGTLFIDTTYRRDIIWAIKGNSVAADRRTLLSPNTLVVGINGSPYYLQTQSEIDLNTAANWDDSDYATPANRAGLDFYFYGCKADPKLTADIILSANSTYPDGYTADNSRKLGGFHCLCVSVGTISGHSLTGFLQGDIIPYSIWDLLYRAESENIGMRWEEKIGHWVDIYMASGTGVDTTSVYGATISDTRNWMNFVDDFAAVKKRMLWDWEFQTIAAGSNEGTSIAGSADPVTTGGHSDTAGRRMVSNGGDEDCCGTLWQRLLDQSYSYGGDSWAWWDVVGGKGQLYLQSQYADVKLVAGGDWGSASHCGSRGRSAGYYRWYAYATVGARGCARPRIVNL
jgi:hypothetical protein